MKKIKLSNILLIGVFVVLTGILIWQAIFSKGIMLNENKISSATSSEELYDYLVNSKYYSSYPISDVKNIRINNLPVQIMKGSKNAVFLYKYDQERINISDTENEIALFASLDKFGFKFHGNVIFIFLDHEFNKITCENKNDGSFFTNLNIFGFEGNQLQIQNNLPQLNITTDLANIHILANKEPCMIDLKTCGSKLIREVDHRTIFMAVDECYIRINDESKELNLDLQMKNSSFNVMLSPETHLSRLNIEGNVKNHSNLSKFAKNTCVMQPISGLTCDSLHIDLKSNEPLLLLLPEEVNERKKDIHISDNIEMGW